MDRRFKLSCWLHNLKDLKVFSMLNPKKQIHGPSGKEIHSRLMYEITGINKKFSDILVELDSTEDAVSLSGGGIEGTTVRFSSILFNKIREMVRVEDGLLKI
ncbi:hypothetical protein K2173_015014 [Erythroxylum novogranatense]|uniref:Uncharacterized protein n=1 Tax=Erythroxylum novogranatense TaxID=1862640 RepID=A0AAV8TX30_9ROSI|nr:hypothetical protein K2173_015014 [Erythroxylum novogranatense]